MQLEELRLEQTKLNHEKVDLENQLEAEQVPALPVAPASNFPWHL